MTTGAQPGWYPDPTNPEIQRWFDGVNWTASVRPSSPGPSYPPPVGKAGEYSPPNWTSESYVDGAEPSGQGPVRSSGMPTGPKPDGRAWYRKKRWWTVGAIAVIVGVAAINGAVGTDRELPAPAATTATAPTPPEPTATREQEPSSRPAETSTSAEPEADEATTVEPVDAAEPEMTGGQRNAVHAATDYLKFTAFSRQGLIEQLEFEGYSTEDATFAVDHLKPDWREQAVRSAEDYLDYSAFSRSGLIDQLKFEGYSADEATYGVDTVDPDWNEQAAKSAQQYLDYSAFSRSALIDQLVFEGFTREQATYGVDQTDL